MDVLLKHQATDCDRRSTDWTTIGARILEAATIASAMHRQEVGPAAGPVDPAREGEGPGDSRGFPRRRIDPV